MEDICPQQHESLKFPMKKTAMTLSNARLERALWQADADMTSSSDIYIRLTEMGLPSEVAIRLKELLAIVKPIGEKMVNIGKIIALKIIEFIEKHPNLAAGIALGAALSSLISSIPIFGQILAPIALPLGITIGAIAGHRIDKARGGTMSSEIGVIVIAQDIIEIAGAFFQSFADTVNILTTDFEA